MLTHAVDESSCVSESSAHTTKAHFVGIQSEPNLPTTGRSEQSVRKAIKFYKRVGRSTVPLVTRANSCYLNSGEIINATGVKLNNFAPQKKNLSRSLQYDNASALKYLKKAEKYEQGLQSTGNLEKAFGYFRIAANKGNLEAQYKTGQYMFEGRGTEKNLSKAFEFLRLAADQGHSEAQYQVGYCYNYKKGTLKDLKRAARYYKLAVKQGNDKAQYRLAKLYWKTEKNDHSAFFKYLKKAANAGNVEAQNDLGTCYFNGIATTVDKAESVKYFQMAAAQGDPSAQFNLAQYYSVEKDWKNAFQFYESAAEGGCTKAFYCLGECYLGGFGTKKDEQVAFDFFKTAAEKGYALSQDKLGELYANGIGTEKDMQKAFHYYKLAADQGYYLAQNAVGDCYYVGSGVEKNLTEAVRYYQMSADQQYSVALNNLAYCHFVGEGTKRSAKRALRYFLLAAEKGNADAFGNLAFFYAERGDSVKAFEYYKLAAESSHDPSTLYTLGNCYFNGEGTRQDFGQAFKHYKLAAELGHSEAQYKVAYCFQKGQGTEINLPAAATFFSLAAGQGHELARAQLTLLNDVKKENLPGAVGFLQLLSDGTLIE